MTEYLDKWDGDIIRALRFQDEEICELAADEIERLRAALISIMQLDGEINPMNYDAHDVSKLNNAFIEAYHIARAALAQGGE